MKGDSGKKVRIEAVDPETPNASWCFDQYYSELARRLENGFDRGKTRPTPASEFRPPAGVLLLAYWRGKPVGCGGVKFHKDGVGEVKRLWVAPKARGRGLGRRLLQELEARAREAGSDRIHLDTNRSLTEAIRLYRATGYTEVEPFNDEPYAHHWFEKRLRAKAQRPP